MKKAILLSVILLTTGFCEDFFWLGLEAYDKGEFDKAAIQWQKACDNKNALGCYNLGVMYEEGKGPKQDYNKVADLYKQACDGGVSDSCSNLGILYKTVKG